MMTDLDKVIKFLTEIAEYFAECRGNASFGSKAEEHFWELMSTANEAAELLKKPQWISVKDRLPEGNGKIYEGSLEESGQVLVYGETCHQQLSYGVGSYIRDHDDKTEEWNGIMDDCELYYCTVTHWMPLPEPPEDARNERK